MMLFLYASVGYIRMLLKNIHHIHSSMTVIFHKKYITECCGTINDNIYHAPICVMEEKNREIKSALKNVLRFPPKEVLL